MMKKVLTLIFMLFTCFVLVGCTDPLEENNEKVENVIKLINEIPSTSSITIEDESYIVEVRGAYNDLSQVEQSKVTNYFKLTSAEAKIQRLKDELEEDLIKEVEQLIDSLPNIVDLTINDENIINQIDNLINSVNYDITNKLSNYMKYELAKDRVEYLKEEEIANRTSKEVIDLISKLPEVDDIKLDHEDLVLNARAKYDELIESAKSLITNYKKLIELENVIKILKEFENFDSGEVLDCISDVVTSYTNDPIILEGENFTVNWKSSNANLFYFEDGFARVSREYQTHRKQNVTVTAEVTLSNNQTITLTKMITVNPVLFDDMPDTPVATYFQSGALSSYTGYSDRYKEEGTLFSEKSKQVLDIIYYAFATIDGEGNVYLSETKTLSQIMDLKNYNTRVVLCIAGVSTEASKNFTTICADNTKRAYFVTNLMNMVEKYNFDGIDIDWESTSAAPVVAVSLNKLMKELREEMTSRQDPAGSDYLLTAAVPASSWGAASDRFDFKTLNKYVDYINMMSYDMNKTSTTTHLSPLYISSYDNGYGFGCDYGVNLFTSKGLDKNKIIIGSAGYGKSYTVSGSSAGSKYPGLGVSASLTYLKGIPGAHASGTLFGNAISKIISGGAYTKYIEYNSSGKIVGSYLYNESAKIYITYDSEEVIAAKYQYAQANEGMGIMCWAYTEDTSDNFVNSIYDVMYK